MLSESLARLFRHGVSLVVGSLLLVALAAAFVWPLWYLASERRRVFNLGVGSVALGILLFLVIRAVVRRRPGRGGD